MRTLGFCLALLATVLAGCSDGASAPEPELDDLGLEATEVTGVIRGVVIDAAISPVAGTTVTARGPDGTERSTESNDAGAFGFDGLEPGTYFLQAEKTGFLTTQQSVDVVADVNDPPIVKILLERDLVNAPYFTEFKWDGFMECGLSVIALCGVAEGTPADVTNDDFAETHPIDQPPKLIQSEVFWKTTTAASDQLWLWHSRGDYDTGAYNGSCNCWSQGVSPLLMVTNETVAAEEEYGLHNDLYLRMFTGSVEGTRNPTDPSGCYPGQGQDVFCGGAGWSLQQDFTVVTHVFYGYLPPADWRYSQDPVVPGPQ